MRRLTNEEFIKKARVVHGDKYDYSATKYVKSREPVVILCPIHGRWKQRPNDHLMGCGCPGCKFDKIASLKRHNVESFIEKAREVHGDSYEYDRVVYVNAITPVEIICPSHGSFWQKPDKHTSARTACPQCSHWISRGEKSIASFLDKRSIVYVREKRFDGLIGVTSNSRLRYDFFLPEYNMLIEYDGEHHFKPVQTKGRLSKEQAIDKHQRCKINDRKKTKYAQTHGYNLVRIRYDEDIERVLMSFGL